MLKQAYSDTCGGQNRNIKIAVFWLHVVANPRFKIETVDQKYFLSGHSWMDSDKDFGVIEKAKAHFSNIFVPSDWVEVVKNSKTKQPFVVTKLAQDDLKSTENLEKAIFNRKVDTDEAKVDWLKIHWLLFTRDTPKKIYFKLYSSNDEVPFRCIDVTRIGGRINQRNIDLGTVAMPSLYPTGRPIAAAKYKDLQELLQFIPPIHHNFYKDLRNGTDALDGGLLEEQDED